MSDARPPGMWMVAGLGRSQVWDGRRLDPLVRQRSFVEIGHEMISTAILYLPLIQVGQLLLAK